MRGAELKCVQLKCTKTQKVESRHPEQQALKKLVTGAKTTELRELGE